MVASRDFRPATFDVRRDGSRATVSRIVGELMSQPLTSGDAAIEVASAHLYEQWRRDAFRRLATHHALMVDAEPERLGVVNRYHAVKRAGLI